VTSTPRHLLKIWTSARLSGAFSRWTIGGSLRAQTTAPGGDIEGCDAQSQNCGLRAKVTMRPYAVLDLRAGYQLSPNWQVALSVNNVFDKRYYLSQNTSGLELWYGEPRNFMLRIDAKY
jgi:outer membrane receptor for ferric coprogen and ferric-rhodotorulic acid